MHIFKRASQALTAAALLMLGVTACGGGDGTPLRLYAMDCGNIEVLDLSVFQPGLGPGVVKNLAVSCYLVTHPSGAAFLFETGVGDSYVGTGKKLIQGFANFSAAKSLAAQLTEVGYPAEKITHLAMSHLHLDHTANSNLFPKAMHLIQTEEYAAAFESADPTPLVADPKLVQSLKNNPVRRLSGDLDVFGDGTVTIKRTIGHTPGHQSLYVKLPKSGNVFLSGDLVHDTYNWVNHVVPGFNFDPVASLKSIVDTEQFLKTNNAVLWIGHDLEQNATIKHAPQYYD